MPSMVKTIYYSNLGGRNSSCVNSMKKSMLFFLIFMTTSCYADDQTRLLRDISEKMSAQLSTLRQWSNENSKQAEILLAQTDTAMDLADIDHRRPNAQTWNNINTLNQNSLGLLQASQSLWDSYGSFNAYLASYKKAEAWQKCRQTNKNCSFRDVLNTMDTKSVEIATRAVQNAEASKNTIATKIQMLESLSFEARSAEGLGSGLDALSKVNAASAASLVDLNNGINTMLQIQAHESANAHTLAIAQEEGSRQILEGGHYVQSPHLQLRISDYVN